MNNEQTVEELMKAKGQLYDEIYLAVNRFKQTTGYWPSVSVSKSETPAKCGMYESCDIKVELVL